MSVLTQDQQAMLKTNNMKKAGPLFGSFVGNHIADNPADYSDKLIEMIKLMPSLKNTKQYERLAVHNPELFDPVDEKEPNVEVTGDKPMVSTGRITEEDVDYSDVPFDVGVARKMVQLHKSATKRKLDFNLTFADVAELLSAETCYYTDEVMGTAGLQQRTIDRLDNSKGYVVGNVVACTYQVNQLKSFLFENPRSEMFMSHETLLKFMFRVKHGRD